MINKPLASRLEMSFLKKNTQLPRQRGVLGLLGGLVLFLSVLFTALAMDTGRLMLEHRRLQLVADMAALDASSQSGGCGDGL
ncbi:MAG: hypothetical protein CVV06_12040 [Gammaproteobacteria bacterium HGW-Gammaproteobacteria-10]|nr:MAG: hypothetical protein CVV06_12040 [Gammaproteobacteria bacterium HGW-Gammaproteobacteria-10]